MYFSHSRGAALALMAIVVVLLRRKASAETQEEIRNMARLLVASLTGFLVAGWFLSRALSIWLFCTAA